MSTTITLQDGRIWSCSNGQFDHLIEQAAQKLERSPDNLPGLKEWLLDQRCEVRGPGIGYLDMRQLSEPAQRDFSAACRRTLTEERAAGLNSDDPAAFQSRFANYGLLLDMWDAVDRGEPPESLTSPHHEIDSGDGTRLGPGW